MSKRGVFITFEGTDGCGKTTQMHLLAERLRQSGREVVETVEPGGTEIGRQVRRILLDSANSRLTARAELLLYFASRAQNVEELIRPALDSGKIVLCDRFTDSTLVYQGCGRGLGAETVWALDRIACQGLAPDVTILLSIDLDTGLERARARNVDSATYETRMDEQARDFYQRVERAYQELAASASERFRVIDAADRIPVVAARVWSAVEPNV